MGTIADKVRQNELLTASQKKIYSDDNVAPAPNSTNPIHEPPAPPPTPEIARAPFPSRGTLPSDMILHTDFAANTKMGGVPSRSPNAPPQLNLPPIAAQIHQAMVILQNQVKAQMSQINNTVVHTVDNNGNMVVSRIGDAPTSPPAGSGYPQPKSISFPSQPPSAPIIPRLRLNATQQLDGLADGATFGKVSMTALSYNEIDPSKSGVLMKGSVPPWINGSFTYSSTTSSITITWSGLTIFKADGTTVNIADSSQTITSLSANQTYFFYPFYNEASQTFGFVSSEDVANLVDIVGASFDGTSGWISTTGNITRPSSYTCEAWIRPAAAQNRVFLELNMTSGSGGPSATYTASFGLSVASTGLLIFLEAGQAQTAGGNLFDGNYHHVVFTYNGTTVVSYLDGVQLASTALTAPASFTGHWRIGGNAESQAGFYSGDIAHVAVYNSVLTLAQIQTHYQTMLSSGPATYEALPVADSAAHYWTLTETTGTTFVDTIAADNGTLQGGVTLAQSNAILGAAGSPDIAWRNTIPQVSQTQSLQGNVGMSSGGMSAATPASGTGGGSTGGSGSSGTGGLCVTPETQIKTKRGNIPFAELVEGDLVLTAAGTWNKVLRLIRHDYTGPVMVMEQGKITPTHQILALDDWTPAKEVFTRWEDYSGEVLNCEVETQDTDLASPVTEHSYTLANGVVAHNSQTRK